MWRKYRHTLGVYKWGKTMSIITLLSDLWKTPYGDMPILGTVYIFVLTLIFALPLGIIIALLRLSKSKIISSIIKLIISILRGTPLMLQLMIVTYGPTLLLKGTRFQFAMPNKLIPVVIAFSINYAAYFAEIYRGGIESISKGQYEAAEVLGYSKTQTFIKIILPQVIRRILPSVTNEIITLVKDTSIAFTVSYVELFTEVKRVAISYTSFMPFIIAGVFYYVFNFIVTVAMERVEKSMSYYQQ